MGKKGGASHLKRMPAPAFWPIHPKEFQWAPKPNPGPHPANLCLPLAVVLRDSLGYAKSSREARVILADGRVKVDGKTRRDRKYPAGLMDVIDLPDANEAYRVVPVKGKGLAPVRITKEEAKFKLCRIEAKSTLRKGQVQLNLHDGRNLLIRVADAKNAAEDVYKVHDTLRLGIPTQKILTHLKFAEGNYAVVTAGRNIGRHGKIAKIVQATATRPATVAIQDPTGETFETVADYVFVVGEDKPVLRIEEA
jgi:small subunit ribosomal protein S4e